MYTFRRIKHHCKCYRTINYIRLWKILCGGWRKTIWTYKYIRYNGRHMLGRLGGAGRIEEERHYGSLQINNNISSEYKLRTSTVFVWYGWNINIYMVQQEIKCRILRVDVRGQKGIFFVLLNKIKKYYRTTRRGRWYRCCCCSCWVVSWYPLM